MTPNEFYALPAISVEPWHAGYDGVVQDVMGLDEWYGAAELFEAHEDDRIVVHQKLHHNVDGERGVTVYALYFDEKPFALVFTGGRGGRDTRDAFVTDPEAWRLAREHALAILSRSVGFEGVVLSADEELTGHYYGAHVARFGDEIRLVSSSDVHPISRNPVYDMKKFDAAFDADVRPLGKEIGYENGLADPRMLQAGIKAFRAGVLGDRIDLDVDLGDGHRMVAASVVDAQTFAHVVNANGRYFTWARDIKPKMVGPASMLACYADFAAGRPIDPGCPYVMEAAEAFGADPGTVHRELEDFLATGGRSMAERIVSRMPRDERVPGTLTYGYETFAIAHMMLDNPDLRRFCIDGYPDLRQARELVEKARELDERIAAGEIKSPTP